MWVTATDTDFVVEELGNDKGLLAQLGELPDTRIAAGKLKFPQTIDHWRMVRRVLESNGLDYKKVLDINDAAMYSVTALLNEEKYLGHLSTALSAHRKLHEVGPPFYDYQLADARFLVERRDDVAILANEQGLGKTRSTLRYLANLPRASGRSLIICPKSLIPVWLAEAEAYNKEFEHRQFTLHELGLSQTQDESVLRNPVRGSRMELVVASYDYLRRNSGQVSFGKLKKTPDGLLNRLWSVVVFDEAHRIKNPRAQQTRAALRVASSAGSVVCLTGTPIEKHPHEMWTYLRMSGLWSSSTKFKNYWFKQWKTPWGVTEYGDVKPELRKDWDNLISKLVRRVSKADVAASLPPKRYDVVPVTMTPKQSRQYATMRKDYMLLTDSGGVKSVQAAIAAFGQLLTIANGEVDVVSDKAKAVKSPKVDWLVDFLESCDKPVVVMSDRLDLLNLAEGAVNGSRELNRVDETSRKISRVDGSMTVEERKQAVEDFQSGETNVFLGSLEACKEGLTLTAADTMVFLCRSWSATSMKQVEDRIHRWGAEAHDSVRYVILVTRETVEEGQSRLLESKTTTLRELLKAPARALQALEGGESFDGPDDGVYTE